jgi:hypothetical protein
MKALTVLFALALALFLAAPAGAASLPGTPVITGAAPASTILQVFRADLPSPWTSSFTLAAMQQQPASDPPKSVDVDIDVDRHEGHRAWYLNPVWMAIGGLGLALVIILIVMAARGGSGGTTVVRG